MALTIKIIIVAFGGLLGFFYMLATPAGPLISLLAISPFDSIFFGLFGTVGNAVTYVPIGVMLMRTSPARWPEVIMGTGIQTLMVVLMIILVISHIIAIPEIGPRIGWEYLRKWTLVMIVALFVWSLRDANVLEPALKVVIVSMALYTGLSALDFLFGISILPNNRASDLGGIAGEEFQAYRVKEWRFAGASLPVNRYGNWLLLPTLASVGWATYPGLGRRQRILALGCLTVLLAGLFGTLSRSAALSFLLGAAVLSVTAFRFNPAQVLGGGLAFGVVGSVVYLVFSQFAVTDAFESRFSAKDIGDSAVGRLDRVATGFLIWAESPIVGVGDAMFKIKNRRQRQGTNAHNAYMSILAEAGLVGFIPWMSLLAISLLRLMRKPRDDIPEPLKHWRPYFLASFVALCVSMFTSGYEYERWLWFTMGFAAVLERAEATARAQDHFDTLDAPFGSDPEDLLPESDLPDPDLPDPTPGYARSELR